MIKSHLTLLALISLGLVLRLYGLMWDSGFHFHPDERMLIMVADRVHFWAQLNPDFFNYGSLPVYLLVGLTQIIDVVFSTTLKNYDGLLVVGRYLSTASDLAVMALIYLISRLLSEKRGIALWSVFLYAVAFFPIQNSHFFIVDTWVNLWTTLTLYLLLRYMRSPSMVSLLLISIVFSASLTSKVSAIIFLPVIILAIAYVHRPIKPGFFSLLAQWISKPFHHSTVISSIRSVTAIGVRIGIFSSTTLLFAFLFMPFAFLEHERFTRDILAQIQMNADAYIFPYTLQYVDTLPYLYYLQQIFLWGLGPFQSFFVLMGALYLVKYSITHARSLHKSHYALFFLLTLWYLVYFLLIGRSAVKFMRYMLLMYPLFALMGGYGIFKLLSLIRTYLLKLFPQKHPRLRQYIFHHLPHTGIVGGTLVWTLFFVNIYSSLNTRILATAWINQYIPEGSVLAVEHWDDRVPIFDPGKYQYEEMTLYELPDDIAKWTLLDEKLNRADYIILASNRLYIPLQNLTDCTKYEKCYPLTAKYYQELFDGSRGFVKVAEFTSYPRLSLFDKTYRIIDDSADESFTVYDHPKIMIFKKNTISTY